MRRESGPVSESRKAGAGRKKQRAGKGQRWAVFGFSALRLGCWRAGLPAAAPGCGAGLAYLVFGYKFLIIKQANGPQIP